MSHNMILALAVLLLPIPLSFIIPPSRRAKPDAWKIRRQRKSLAFFSLSVGVIYTALIRYQMSLLGNTTVPPEMVTSIYLWSIMAWLFLGLLIYELRKPAADPFPGSKVRSASLAPREQATPVPNLAWWALRTAWGLAVVLLISRPGDLPASSLIILASSLFLLLMGPWIDRRQLLGAPEPLLSDAPADLATRLQREYMATRARRSWSLYLLFVISVAYKIWLAALLAEAAIEHYVQPLLHTVLGVLFVFIAVNVSLELYSHHRVKVLRRACVVGAQI